MNRNKNIENELSELRSSLPVAPEAVFTVPEGYFEQFPRLLLDKIRQDVPSEEIRSISPLLASISRKMPLSVPDQYFEDLAAETEITSPVLEAAGRSMPYSVPAHYFEDLPDAIQSLVWKPKARVVSFRRRMVKLAAAATITGVMAIAGWFYFSQPSAVPVEQSEEWVAKKLNGVSNQELDEFINLSGEPEPAEPLASGGNADVRQMLDGVTDTDIDDFLAQVPDEEELSIN